MARNVRELENVIERAVILTRGNTLNIQLHELNIPKHSRLKTALETPSSLENGCRQLHRRMMTKSATGLLLP